MKVYPMLFKQSLLLVSMALIISACQPPANRDLNITIDADTTAAVLTNVAAEDSSISAAIEETLLADDAQTTDPNAKTPQAVAALPSALLGSTPPTSLNPHSFTGLNSTVLIARLGAPDYLRVDAEIEIYQYRLDHCVVDFVAMPTADEPKAADTPATNNRIITSIHSRHRIMGKAYDDVACRLDLGRIDKTR